MISQGRRKRMETYPEAEPAQTPLHSLPFWAGQLYRQESCQQRCHRVSQCNGWSLMSRQCPAEPPRVQGAPNNKTWHQPAVEAHKIPVSCYTMMPGLRLHYSVLHFVTQLLFWSESQQALIWEAVPLKGSMKGSEMKRLLLKAGLGQLPGATGSPNLALCFLLTFQHPLHSLSSDRILWVSYAHNTCTLGKTSQGLRWNLPSNMEKF